MGAPEEVRGVDHAEHGPTDEALVRLEDVLLDLPDERAVPDLDEVLARAGVDHSLLARDERALKLLHEALVARPFGSLAAVQRVRTEVELLTLEAELLAERLRDPATPPDEAHRISARVDVVRARLAELQREL